MTCETCGGSGRIYRQTMMDGYAAPSLSVPCPACSGKETTVSNQDDYIYEQMQANPAAFECPDQEAELARLRAENARLDDLLNFSQMAETVATEQRDEWRRQAEATNNDLNQVMGDLANALGCEPDNEKMLNAIDALRSELARGEKEWNNWKAHAVSRGKRLRAARDKFINIIDKWKSRAQSAEAALATIATVVNPMWQAKHDRVDADWIIEQLKFNEAENSKEIGAAEAAMEEMREKARAVCASKIDPMGATDSIGVIVDRSALAALRSLIEKEGEHE